MGKADWPTRLEISPSDITKRRALRYAWPFLRRTFDRLEYIVGDRYGGLHGTSLATCVGTSCDLVYPRTGIKMARLLRAGEKQLRWVGSSKEDLLRFPEPVKDSMGAALSLAQFGGKHPAAKPWKGQGPGVFEIVDDFAGNTYRAVYGALWAGFLFSPRLPEEIADGNKNRTKGC